MTYFEIRRMIKIIEQEMKKCDEEIDYKQYCIMLGLYENMLKGKNDKEN